MPPNAQNPWVVMGQGKTPAERARQPLEPAMKQLTPRERLTAVANYFRGAPAPVAAPDMTLTGDLAAGSARQQSAQDQFDANMRARQLPVEPPTDDEAEAMKARDAAIAAAKMRAYGG